MMIRTLLARATTNRVKKKQRRVACSQGSPMKIYRKKMIIASWFPGAKLV
jgi:hypothetical protein